MYVCVCVHVQTVCAVCVDYNVIFILQNDCLVKIWYTPIPGEFSGGLVIELAHYLIRSTNGSDKHVL